MLLGGLLHLTPVKEELVQPEPQHETVMQVQG